MTKTTNLYRDEHSGGFVVEVLALGRWYRLGVYGSRAAAIRAAKAVA